jgi:hypothetical protein
MSSFGAPIDPAYTAFLDGLKRVAALPVGKSLDRWHPKDAHWYPYDPKLWGQEDLGAAPTPPDDALRKKVAGIGDYEWDLQELQVPRLFADLKEAYAALSSQHPTANLVWTPVGGEWRSAFEHAPPPPKSDPGHDDSKLPPDAQRQIADVREQERLGEITHVQAETSIKRIRAEYGQG